MFNENFNHSDPFTVNTKDFPFVNLSDLIKENGHRTYKVQKVFTLEPKKGRSKGKEVPVIVMENHCVYVPMHLLGDIKKILANQDYIQAINNGACGFATSEYEDQQYGNGTCYSGNFVDI